MTDLDVSLRLRLDNQLSRPAETAEKDLKELQRTLDKIGKSKGGDGIATDLKSAGRSAKEAANDIEAMKRQLGSVDTAGDNARRSIEQIGTAASNARREVNRIGDGAFDGLKADAKAAGDAIDRVTRKAREANNLPHSGRGIAPSGHVPGGSVSVPRGLATSASNAAGAAYDAVGADGLVVLGSGGAVAAGSAIGGAAIVAGKAFKDAANDEYRSDQLAVTGGYDEKKQAEIDAILRRAGMKRGVGESGAQAAYGKLLAGGMKADDAAAITDNALVFAKATESDPQDVGAMTVAMKDNMNITNDQVRKAFDIVFYGGNAGSFEPKDMARNFPELLAGAQMHNSTGLDGIALIASAAQSVIKKSGSAAEASTKMKGLLNDLNSKGISDNLKDYGVDVLGTEARAKKAGKDPLMAVFDEIHQKIGLDAGKLGTIFTNDEGKTAITAILQDLPKIKAMISEMRGLDGYTDKNYDRATGNVNSQAERLFSNVWGGVKSFAQPALPIVGAALKSINDRIEMSDEEAQAARDKLANNRQGATSAYGAKRGKESYDWTSFLHGSDVDGRINFADAMGLDLRPVGEEAMQGLGSGIEAQRDPVIAAAAYIADEIKAMFGFTVTPTIQPTFLPPNGGSGGIQNGDKISVTNHITTPNARAAGRAAVKEQNRRIQGAKARSLSSTGKPIQ